MKKINFAQIPNVDRAELGPDFKYPPRYRPAVATVHDIACTCTGLSGATVATMSCSGTELSSSVAACSGTGLPSSAAILMAMFLAYYAVYV